MTAIYCSLIVPVCLTRGEWISLIGGFGGAFTAFLAAIVFEAWVRHRNQRATLRHYKNLLEIIRDEFDEWPVTAGNVEFWNAVTGDRARRMTGLLRQLRSTNDWLVDHAPVHKFEIWIEANNIRDILETCEKTPFTEEIWTAPILQINFGEPRIANLLQNVRGRLYHQIDDTLRRL